MTLKELIEKTNQCYNLNLTVAQCDMLKDRLRMSGCPATVEKKSVSGTVGAIMSVASSIKPNKALETYSRLTQGVVKSATERCPRCNNRMQKVDIVTRKVNYCANCKIALPLPV